jgi:hypothetical protein
MIRTRTMQVTLTVTFKADEPEVFEDLVNDFNQHVRDIGVGEIWRHNDDDDTGNRTTNEYGFTKITVNDKKWVTPLKERKGKLLNF